MQVGTAEELINAPATAYVQHFSPGSTFRAGSWPKAMPISGQRVRSHHELPLDFSRQIDDAVQRLLAHAGGGFDGFAGAIDRFAGALRA